MKKIIFSLAVVLGLASCNSWDDEHTQNYGDGPAVTIDLTTTADSSFTFTVNPAQGTNYYTYSVVEGAEAQDLSAETVYKNTVSGAIVGSINKVEKTPSITQNMRNPKTNAPLCKPNTSYVVYAVAADANGVLGKVASIVVTTSDGKAPVVVGTLTADSIACAKFSEGVTRGTGAVTAKYYMEWDPAFAPIAVPAEDINITADGDNLVSFTAKNVPAGAFLFFSWEEGAFVDSKGNKCPAMNSDFNMSTGQPLGVFVRMPLVQWQISLKNVGPQSGSLISDYKTWEGTITFDKNVYRNDNELKGGEISLYYRGAKKTTLLSLEPSDWSIEGNVVKFHMPEPAAPGDVITLVVNENTLYDVCGNGNEEFMTTTKDVWWKYFAATKDMVLGNFAFTYVSAYDEEPKWYDGGSITIEEDPEAEVENGIIIKNLYLEGSEIPGEYDLNSGKVYVYAYYKLGLYTTPKGATYGMITYSLSGKNAIEFTINPDGTLTSTDFGVVACDENYESALGWFEQCSTAKFTPAAAAGAAKRAKAISAKSVKKANVKMSAKALRRTVRK